MTDKESIALLAQKERFSFEDLRELVRLLRTEDGCTWDRAQTHHSIRSCLIEETYEVVEAIDSENAELMREELGDLLFQILFHAQLEEEANSFTVAEVIDDICKKMLRRHPHIFGTPSSAAPTREMPDWEAIKNREKHRNSLSARLRAIPPMLPALMRASKVQKKSAVADGLSKAELCQQLQAELSACADAELTEERMGTLLMKLTSLAVVENVDAECALSHAIDDYIRQVEREEKVFH